MPKPSTYNTGGKFWQMSYTRTYSMHKKPRAIYKTETPYDLTPTVTSKQVFDHRRE